MSTNPQELADLFGAKHVGEVPTVGGGPFGMAQLAHIMHERLTPSQGERPGRPTDARWEKRRKVQMTEETWRQLGEIARKLSTASRKVSPMQVAAQLLEAATNRIAGTALSTSPGEIVGTDENSRAQPVAKPKRTRRQAQPNVAESDA